MARPEQHGYDGLSALAHAIRRSTALKVAMEITPPECSIDQMLATADRLAAWIGGRAAEREAEQREDEERPSLGVPFDQREGL